MSTSLKNHKRIATLVKTLTHFYESSFGNENPDVNALGNKLHDFIMTTDTNLGGGTGHLDKELLEKKLFEHLATNNLKEFITSYPEEQNEPGFVDGHSQETLKVMSGLDKLDKLSAPFNGHGVGFLQAMLNDMIHGFEDMQDPIVRSMDKLSNELARYSVMMHPEMPESLPGQEEIMQAFMSVQLYGDKYMGEQNGFRHSIDSLEGYGYTDTKSHRTFYANDVLANLVVQHLENKSPVRFYASGSSTSKPLENFKSYSGLEVKIQSDVPDLGRPAVFVVAKVLNEMKDRVINLPDERLVKEGAKSATRSSDVMEFKKKLSDAVQGFNNRVSCELEGYSRFWNRDFSKEDDLSIDR